jgi:Flp pilus assembly protein TadD
MKRGNFERARSDLVRARDLNPDLSTPHHGLGVLSETVGSVADAERHYRAALKVDPGFAPARINLGRLLYQRGATEEAREQFARLTEVAPEYPEGWTGLCETLLRLDRTSEAQAVLETARSRFGSSPPIELLAARLLLRKSAFSEAATHLERVTREADRRQVAAAFAWLAVARLCEGKGDAAAAAADRAAALNPDDAVARYALLAAHRVANR